MTWLKRKDPTLQAKGSNRNPKLKYYNRNQFQSNSPLISSEDQKQELLSISTLSKSSGIHALAHYLPAIHRL